MGALNVEFTYREAGDDLRDRPGRELTRFAADGDVLDSQGSKMSSREFVI
ncbi:MAG: hypothetical protein H0X34_18105 [Chthoniobacterales bacterium]|nr:hypothetical protein [Chthoniobacterales bacterium]